MPSRLDVYRSSLFGSNNANSSSNEERQLQETQLQGYLRNQRLSRATLSRRELQEHTDVKFFISSTSANSISFFVVLVVTFCVGYMGYGRDVKGAYMDISAKYETLITPVYWIIPSSWVMVFIFETVHILFSSLNKYNYSPIVQDSVGYRFFYINCCQIGWIVSYCFDVIWLAFTWMVINIAFLVWLNLNLYYRPNIDQDQRSGLPQSREEDEESGETMTVLNEWLVFRLPFQVHLGWALFVVLLNLNELWISLDWAPSSQLAVISVIAIWSIGIFVLFYPKHPVFCIPLIITWATAGVWINLNDPSQVIMTTYPVQAIARVHGGIIATCLEHAIIALIRFLYFFSNTYSLMEKQPR